jgi:hypothetical protein
MTTMSLVKIKKYSQSLLSSKVPSDLIGPLSFQLKFTNVTMIQKSQSRKSHTGSVVISYQVLENKNQEP